MSPPLGERRRSRRAVVGLVSCALVLAGCGSPGRSTVPTCPPLAVPAYAPPASGMWPKLEAAGTAVGWVIINPSNGPGGRPRPGYQRVVAEARRRDQRVLGYVPTGRGHRPASSVIAAVDEYRRWYGVTGIFFDEVPSSAGFEPLYRRLVSAVHAHHGVAVLNPGTLPAPGYFDFADAVVTFEGSESRYERRTTQVRPPGHVAVKKVWGIVLGTPRRDLRSVVRTAARRGTGGIFVTDRDGADPYDHLPSYWQAETRLPSTSCPAGAHR